MSNIFVFLAGTISGYFLKIISWIKILCLYNIRLDKSVYYSVYEVIKEKSKYNFKCSESVSSDNFKLPEMEAGWCYCSVPLYYSIAPEFLKAGYEAKEYHFNIIIPRFLRKRFLKFLDYEISIRKTDNPKIFLNVWGSCFSTVGELNKKHTNPIYLQDKIVNDIDSIVTDVINKERNKAGIILYGPPGNGKTSIIKDISLKYCLDIYVVMLHGLEDSNLICLLNTLKKDNGSIIVFEDFDNVFNNRKPCNENLKLSFDTFLNLLDGLYTSYENKVMILTCNNIENVDTALKNRPSRFDYIAKIDNPTFSDRVSILEGYKLNGSSKRVAEMTDGKSAAVVCEIGKRFKNKYVVEDEVKDIIASFEV